MARPEMHSENLPVSCFAPELTEESIKAYESLISALPRRGALAPVKDGMKVCLDAVKAWWELPESQGNEEDQFLLVDHRKTAEEERTRQRVKVTTLTPDLVAKLWDSVPWAHELDAVQSLFDRTFNGPSGGLSGVPVDPQQQQQFDHIRHAAYHLLWYARELCLDREPLTQTKLNGS